MKLLYTHVAMRTRAGCARSMAVLLESGVSMHEMLTTISQSAESGVLSSALLRVQERVLQGTSLADACDSDRRIFGPLWVGLLRTGERSGTLAKNLSLVADIYERQADLEQEVNNALLYPKIVLIASVLLGGGLTLFVLPQLTGLFSNFKVALPLPTRILISITNFTTKHTLLLIVSVAILVSAWIYLRRITRVRILLDRAQLSVPVIGILLRNYHTALTLRLMSTLLASGTTLDETIVAIGAASENSFVTRILHSVEGDVRSGTPLSRALKEHSLIFSALTVATIAVGEKSGTLSATCERLSEYHERDVIARARRLPVVIEPILLIGIAGIVGTIALAIIMPIYAITGNLRNL